MKLSEYLKNNDPEIEVLDNGILKIVEPEKTGTWKPNLNDKYFYLSAFGNIQYDVWQNNDSDESFMPIGNIFKTREEAEQAVERLKIRAELLEAGGIEIQNVTNTFDIYDKYFLLRFDGEDEKSGIDIVYNTIAHNLYHAFDIVFKSEEEAKKAVEKIGEDRIKKYLFGVNIDD